MVEDKISFTSYLLEIPTLRDIPGLMALETEAFIPVDRWTEQDMVEEITVNSTGFRLVRDGAVVAAYINFQVGYDRLVGVTGSEDEGTISSIAVLRKHRDKGLGRLMLGYAVDELKKLGVPRIVFDTRTDNVPMINLSQSLGFVIETVDKRFYRDGADAYKMVLKVGDKSIWLQV